MEVLSQMVPVYKQMMGKYPTGVTIVTALNEDGVPVGLTANSFASVSLDPLLVLWSIDRRVSSFQVFRQAKGFAIHVLASNQADACWAFAGKEPDRFSKVSWHLSNNRLPIISGSLGVLECTTYQQVEAGDHVILIGKVMSLQYEEDKTPLIYFNREAREIPNDWSMSR